jgi:threonyl-tRNA synthetase
MNPEDMSPLDKKRHSLAHLLAAAVLEHYPDAQPTLGPPVDNGFYYDFGNLLLEDGDADLKKIQKSMKKLLNKWHAFESKEVSKEDALKIFTGNKYKEELITDITKRGEKITLYTSDDFTDLCRGGHVEDMSKDVSGDCFKLDKVAGAYWRGDEKNDMLTRIYGLAFDSKEDLDAHLLQVEEAKKRDHRKLGKELDLFTFSELVGPGLPLWTPTGTKLRNLLDEKVWELREARGYEKVEIPHITKKDLFEKSGHWDKFSDELFKITTREGHEFAMKPMNCPFHTQIFARKPFSYKDMPQRYANSTMCYRDEQSGELHGLSRVRSFTQDDAHVFCLESQFVDEAIKVWEIIEEFYASVGFTDLKVRLSLKDPAHPENYKGDDETWQKTEDQLREIIQKKGTEYVEGIGEAAFYGPKIDFISKDSIGREWQVATIQADRSMPESFDLTITNEKGEKERVVMIHAAIMGSIERFLSIYIEHTAGNFPLWLAPTQVSIIPVAEAHNDYATSVMKTLADAGLRTELLNGDEGFGKKVRKAKTQKNPYFLIIGDEEVEKNEVTVESRDNGKIGSMSIDAFLERINDEK